MESNTGFFRCSGGFFLRGSLEKLIQVVHKIAGDCELRGSDRWLFGWFLADLRPQDGNKHGGTTVLDEGLF